jgi:ribonuclease HII
MPKPVPDLSHEKVLAARYGTPVAGLDEAGRGPWAGPVVAAAVIWPEGFSLAGLTDSKALTPARRAALYDHLVAAVPFGIGVASVMEIDQFNILRATERAMARALAALPQPVAAALVDGSWAMPLPVPVATVVGGDGRCLSIAAASVIAKVTRDRMMAALDVDYPGYGWASNAGYGVPAHAEALRRLGPSPQHRRSFKPVRAVLQLGDKSVDD